VVQGHSDEDILLFDRRITMRLVYAMLLLLLNAARVVAQDVTFTCKIMGSDKDTVSLAATNIGSNARNCRATCTVTRRDGRTQALSFSGGVPGNSENRFFNGKGGVAGAPLSNPIISHVSCAQ
jgi:hypothetical protein